MEMALGRFLEYSGHESRELALDKPSTLRVLERIDTFLLYETGVCSPSADYVRVGQVRDIRAGDGRISFRFSEIGRIPTDRFDAIRQRLQIDKWEMTRTHWAVKDGDVPQDVVEEIIPTPKKYDIVLSFAGEDRTYVEGVAEYLEQRGIVVFYDKYEEVTLWGKDLSEHFDSVFRKQGRFCVMFISKHYAEKVWTRHERRSALARALEERVEYVLPVRFDASEIPGLRPNIGYLDLTKLLPEELGQRILQKLGRP